MSRFLAMLLLSILATAGLAQDGALRVVDPYIYATPPRAQTAGGYLTLTNDGTAPDRLLSASTPGAMVMIHRSMTGDDGVARMEHQMGGVEIPAGGTVTFAPGGLHLMLTDLNGPLADGDMVPVTLTFERAGAVTVDVPVIRRGAEGHDGTGHGAGG